MKIYVILKWLYEEKTDEVSGAVLSRENLQIFFDKLKEKDTTLVQKQRIPDNPRDFYTIPILKNDNYEYCFMTIDSDYMP